MNIKTIIILPLIILIIGFISCQRFFSLNNNHPDNDTIYDHVWNLESVKNINGDLMLIPDSAWEFSVEFDLDGSLYVISACNTGEGIFSIKTGDSLDIEIGCTEMACNANYQGYCDDLNHATRFDLSNDQLSIYFTNRSGNQRVLIHE